jgi:hypothetical protein
MEAPKLSDRIVPAPGDKDVDVGKGEAVAKKVGDVENDTL